MLRKIKWQIPGQPLAFRYNWCQGPVQGRGPAVEKHWYILMPPCQIFISGVTWRRWFMRRKIRVLLNGREGVIDTLNTITLNTTRRVAETVYHVCISVSITLWVQGTHTVKLSRLYHFPYGSGLKEHPAENDIKKRDYTLITNLMHWLLFIHKILFSSTCLEHQVLIFRRT